MLSVVALVLVAASLAGCAPPSDGDGAEPAYAKAAVAAPVDPREALEGRLLGVGEFPIAGWSEHGTALLPSVAPEDPEATEVSTGTATPAAPASLCDTGFIADGMPWAFVDTDAVLHGAWSVWRD